MHQTLSYESYWLLLTVFITALLWLPYILNRMHEHGTWPALWNPEPDLRPKAAWAERMMRAHNNAVEYLVIFAPLVILVDIYDISTPVTRYACLIYFFARVAHFIIYALAIPLLRTLAFLIGFAAQLALLVTLLANA